MQVEGQPPPLFTFIDLFSGLGGFHTALRGLGGKGLFASEWIEPLRVLYEKNYGLMPHGDINKVPLDTIPVHDVLTAGFPCQPFSKAGEQLGFEHTEQGDLFFTVASIIKLKRPSYFILENVPNILRHRKGETIITIRETLESLGYSVQYRRYSPHEFGIPQVRDRVYIIGSLSGLNTFSWPIPENKGTDIRSVLDANPQGSRPLSEHSIECLNVWNDFLARSPRELKLPSFPIWAMEFGATYPFEEETPFAVLGREGDLGKYKGSFGASIRGGTPAEQLNALPSHARRPQLKFPKWKVDFIRQNRLFYRDNREWIDPWLPKLRSFPSSWQKFEWNAQGEERDLWKLVVQFRASGVRVKRSQTAPSLVAMTDTQIPIIGWERRYMTPRECSRLQSLGEIELPQSRPAAYRALGNAVNAEVVRLIAEPLLASFVGIRSVTKDQAA